MSAAGADAKSLSVDEELKLAKLHAARYARKQALQPKPDASPKPFPEMFMFFDIEARNKDHTQGPPSSIGAVVGSLEEGKIGIVDRFYVKMLMPVSASWDDSTAHWTLDAKGGGGDAMVTRDAKDAVDAKTGITAFYNFILKWEKLSQRLCLSSDAPYYDPPFVSYWISHYCGTDRQIYYAYSTPEKEFRPIKTMDSLILAKRAAKNKPGYDARCRDSMNEELSKHSISHDHTPLNDATKMYWIAAIGIHVEQVFFQHDPKKFYLSSAVAALIKTGPPKEWTGIVQALAAVMKSPVPKPHSITACAPGGPTLT